MSFYSDMLNQTATYWPAGTEDDFGNISYGSPQVIDCRWEDDSELFRDENGDEIMSNAVVYVNQDLEIEGYLYEGESTATDPTTVEGAKQIKQFESLPSMEGDLYQKKVWL